MEVKDIKIEKLDNFGRGISYFNNKIIFIANALVGEIVDVEIIKDNKKYYEGKVINYKKKSKKRIKPICPYFGKCGGCSLMHFSYEDQLSFKQDKVDSIVTRICKLDNVVEKTIFDKNLNYRNKATFKVKEGMFGFYEENTNKIIDIDYCYLLNDKINSLIKVIKEKINLNQIREIMIRVTSNDEMIVFYGTDIDEGEILKLKEYASSIYTFEKEYKHIYGKSHIMETLGDLKLLVSPNSFLQVNNGACKRLYDIISSLISSCNNLLDLYCGVGSIGLYVNSKCKNIVGVEIVKDAINDANKNKKLNNLKNIKFYNGRANQVIEKLKKEFDCVIVDPPRKGLDKKTVELLQEMKARKIIYVSCDINTLARDINLLKSIYKVKQVIPVDMFPNTYHIECVCDFELKIKNKNLYS